MRRLLIHRMWFTSILRACFQNSRSASPAPTVKTEQAQQANVYDEIPLRLKVRPASGSVHDQSTF